MALVDVYTVEDIDLATPACLDCDIAWEVKDSRWCLDRVAHRWAQTNNSRVAVYIGGSERL